jgi:hypothetical protein
MSHFRHYREVRMSALTRSVHVHLIHCRTLLWGINAALLYISLVFRGHRAARNLVNHSLCIYRVVFCLTIGPEFDIERLITTVLVKVTTNKTKSEMLHTYNPAYYIFAVCIHLTSIIP